MIIVSQDNKTLINFDNVVGIYIENPLENNNGNFRIVVETYTAEYNIGEYKTEERAREVLHLIMFEYSRISNDNKFKVCIMPEE